MRILKALLYLLIAVIVIVSYFALRFHHSTAKYYRCSDFKTRQEAQKAYDQGATNLDGRSKDGKKNGLACESLPFSYNE